MESMNHSFKCRAAVQHGCMVIESFFEPQNLYFTHCDHQSWFEWSWNRSYMYIIVYIYTYIHIYDIIWYRYISIWYYTTSIFDVLYDMILHLQYQSYIQLSAAFAIATLEKAWLQEVQHQRMFLLRFWSSTTPRNCPPKTKSGFRSNMHYM